MKIFFEPPLKKSTPVSYKPFFHALIEAKSLYRGKVALPPAQQMKIPLIVDETDPKWILLGQILKISTPGRSVWKSILKRKASMSTFEELEKFSLAPYVPLIQLKHQDRREPRSRADCPIIPSKLD